ncbi:MAG: phosphoribosyl-ATP diphosphatase [Bacillota bacterium]|nr:phosphoribosyl-ATP diphosphatase [Bacillota bacterium]
MNAIEDLYKTIEDRKQNKSEGSYTCYLFEQGIDKILKKVGEECAETIIASKNGVREQVVLEVSDLTYHLLVMLAELNIPLSDIESELTARAAKIGNLKTFKYTDKNTLFLIASYSK